MKYEKPTAEVVVFDNSDVITTSAVYDCKNPSLNGGNGCPQNQKHAQTNGLSEDPFTI